MNAMDLLEVIGGVKDRYIWDAHSVERPRKKPLQLKKALLIAAIIALTLLLVGCAVVYVLGLEDLSVGQYSFDAGFGKEESGNFISLQGYSGSPGYQAVKEWRDFEAGYDPDGKLLNLADYDDYVTPESYRAYNCYTREMADKVDEICQKYRLTIPQRTFFDVPYSELMEIMGIQSLLTENAEAEPQFYVGYCDSDGNFRISADMTLPGEGPYPISCQYGCSVKTSFSAWYMNIGDIESYRQWDYETKGGDQVLLALSGEKALIFADMENFFIGINVLYSQDEAGQTHGLSADALQVLADAFDFSYSPRIDTALAQQRSDERQAAYDARQAEMKQAQRRESYADYLTANFYPSDTDAYLLLDLDGNGVEELAYCYGGAFQMLFTKQDGYVEQVEWFGYSNGYQICRRENGEYALEMVKSVGEQTYTGLFSLEGNRLVYRDFLKLDSAAGSENPWFRCRNAAGTEIMALTEQPMEWEAISLGEYAETLGSYLPLTDQPQAIGSLLDPEGAPPRETAAPSTEPVTIDGYQYPSQETVRLTIGVEKVLRGEEAYRELLAQNTEIAPPGEGQAYILVTVNVKYEDGGAETLELYEESHATLEAARIQFNIPNEESNSVNMTPSLQNPIWGHTLSKGESVSGDIAFMVDDGNTMPLIFLGYGQVAKFQIY